MHKRLIELTQDTRLPLALTLLSGFAGGLLIIWQASLLSSTIDGVFLKQQTLTDVWPDLRLLVLIFAGRAILAWASEVSASAVAVQIKSKLRERLFVHLGRLGPGFVRGERTGELVAAAQEGVETLDAYYSQYLPQLVISAVVPLSILVFVFPLDPISGLILLLTAPLIPLFMVLIGRAAEGLTQRQYETLGRLSAHFLDSLQGLTTLKQFGRSKAQTKNIAAVSERFRDATLQVMRVTFLSAFALELLATLSVAVIAVEIGLRLLYGQMVFQQALFLLVLAPEFYMPLRMLGQRFHSGMAGTTAARHVFQILDIGEQATGTQSAALTSPRLSSEAPFSSLEFSHVSYTYPGESVPALNDVTMTLHCGQRIALIGSSGGGKSTLATLLLRFAEPSLGQILIDGQPLADVPADLWRLLIAWVPQDPFLFHDTIAANIRLSDPAANPQSVTEAAQAAHLDEFIESLPDRYETVIGEAGARLSGGQAQRLALARAFLRNAPILLLDEPTSSLDLEQEQLLEDSLRKLAGRGRPTIITIAHRLATVMAADQILVLENGAVAENGSPAELLARGGSFAAMVAAFREKTEKAGSQWPSSEGRKRSRTPWDASATQSDQGQGSWDSPSPRTTAGPFVRLLALLRGSLWQVLLSVALGALTIFASVGLMGTSAYLISAAALRPPIASLEIAIVGVRFFGLSRAAFRYLERLVSHGVTLRVLARLRTWFYGALEPLAPARLMQYRSGDLLARIVADVDNLENFYVRAVAPPVVALIVISAVALFLANFDDRLGWAAILFLSLVGIGLPILSRALSSHPARNLVGRRAELTSLLVDGIQGLADLTAFDRLAGWGEQIDAASREAGRAQLRLARVAGVSTALTGLLAGLGMWAVLVIAIGLVRDGDLDGVALASLTLITLASFEAVTPLPQSSQLLISCLESARRLFEVVDVAPSVRESPLPTVAGLTPVASLRQGIEVKELSFRYSPDGPEALKGVSFSMRPGEAVAVIGRNGAGKSTLFNLLLRFWEYNQGEILADGQSIRRIASDQVRQLFAVVSQNSHFFNATVSENLRLGNREATTEQVETAARQAQIHESLMSLPHGYETRVGERGTRLSGGERQRMAVARALLKRAPVLLLDEPTANLDPQNARALLEMLFDLMREGGRSTLMITHRLWGLEHFDEILVLDEGRIVERGTHAGLLAEGGLYRRFWELENRSF